MKRNVLCAFGLAALVLVAGCQKVNPRLVTRLNEPATLAGKLPHNPLGDRIITSWVEKGDAQQGTMSTLFGNDAAVQFARGNASQEYPAGSIVSLVTWNQQEDERWFGGNIPAAVKSVEIVTVKAGADGKPAYVYQRFEGSPLQQADAQESAKPGDRAAYLLSQRAAVLP